MNENPQPFLHIGKTILCLLVLAAAMLAAGCAGTSAPLDSGGATGFAAAQRMPCRGPQLAFDVGAFDEGQAQGGGIGQGIAQMLAESLRNSACLHQGTAAAKSQGAKLRILGTITAFESPCKGGSLIVLEDNQACVTLEIRVVDPASGELLHAARAEGDSAVAVAGLKYARGALPAALGVYAGTPMEQAIRNCIEQAADNIVNWVSLTGT